MTYFHFVQTYFFFNSVVRFDFIILMKDSNFLVLSSAFHLTQTSIAYNSINKQASTDISIYIYQLLYLS